MEGVAVGIGEGLKALQEFNAGFGAQVKGLLALASQVKEPDGDAAEALLRAIDEVGRCAQAREGELVLLLAQADRLKSGRGGLGPWVAQHLDVTEGGAQGIAQSAREIGLVPELAGPLASGRIGVATIRVLTRTARAVKGTDLDLAQTLTAALAVSAEQGVRAANKRVRILEETVDPGRAERLLQKQRSRSFLRVVECESGMYRIEALLDPERASEFRAVLDQTDRKSVV